MNTKHLFSLLLCMAFILPVLADPPEEGKTIFMTRCAACHNVNKVLTGPALAGVHERRSIDWIVKFVHSSQTLVKSGDKDAVAVYEQFNKVPMPDHPDLTEANIKNVIEYIKSATKTEDKTPFAKPLQLKTAYQPLSLQKDYMFFIGYLLVVGLLVTSLWFAVNMRSLKKTTDKEGTA